ncbi:hypothetical protein BDV93DRAFT_580991 [Ceratobasidium sp. AG-I]|nr:hypothetical protein BDV93DRAFT_580991 [Ceratobasidium sp. AG-I]
MLLARLGHLGALVISGNALPLTAKQRLPDHFLKHHIPDSRFLRAQPHVRPLRRNEPDWAATLELWIPDGVSGYIDLMSSPSLNATSSNHTLVHYAVTNGTSVTRSPNKIAEMGYTQTIQASDVGMDTSGPWLMNAKSPGWGTKFWMLKSHDKDCFAGSPLAASYISGVNGTGTGTGNGTEYPVTLRSPLANDKYYGTYAYCATYDPNPTGSGMTIGAAPCGRISCAPLPPPPAPPVNADALGPESSDPFVPAEAHNPDGTLAPTFFSTRPCNYMDPNCHVSQIFLYNSLTGALRPMYHTARMVSPSSNANATTSSTTSSGALWKNVDMVFRQGNRRPMQGWAEPDPAAVVVDPAFGRKSVPQPFTLARSPVYLAPNLEVYAVAMKEDIVASTSPSSSPSVVQSSGLASGSVVRVFLVPPTRSIPVASQAMVSGILGSMPSGRVGLGRGLLAFIILGVRSIGSAFFSKLKAPWRWGDLRLLDDLVRSTDKRNFEGLQGAGPGCKSRDARVSWDYFVIIKGLRLTRAPAYVQRLGLLENFLLST